MKSLLGIGSVLSLLVMGGSSMVSAQGSNADTASIQGVLKDLEAAWKAGDAKAYAAHFAEDGTFVNVLGQFFKGREAFEKRHADLFLGPAKASTVTIDIASLRFVRPDVALLDADCTLSGAAPLPGLKTAPDGIVRSKMLLVLVKEKGAWWMTAYHNVAVVPLPPRP